MKLYISPMSWKNYNVQLSCPVHYKNMYFWCVWLNFCIFQERLKNIYSLIHELENKRSISEHNLNNVIKTHDKLSPDDKVTSYYQQKLKNIYNTAVLDAHQEEDLLRKSLEKINEIRFIRNERRIQVIFFTFK